MVARPVARPLVVLLLLVLHACSGDDTNATATATATATAGLTTTGTSTTVATTTATAGESDTNTSTTTEPTTTATTATTDAATTDASTTAATTDASTTAATTTGGLCLDVLPNPAGDDAILAPKYVGTYFAYDLGPVPAPGGQVLPRLGGLVVAPGDPDTMLVIGPSEVPEAKLHRIGVERGACGHILGFVGEAEEILTAPYLDLMVNGPKGVVFLSHYPTKQLSQYHPFELTLAATHDLAPLGQNQSPGGLNFVPPGYPDAGMLRVMGFPTDHNGPGTWSRADINWNGATYDIAPLVKTVDVPYGPGGFAYIPEGSPLFPEQRIMVTEWLSNPRSVSSYVVDAEGDPIIDTRELFFESFVKPWGSYFEPETGDYIFLQWEAQPDHVFIVQGFVPPPPLPG